MTRRDAVLTAIPSAKTRRAPKRSKAAWMSAREPSVP